MRFHKIRIIQSGGGTCVGGVSLPQEVFIKWQNHFVSILESGNCIIIQKAKELEPLTNKELLKDSIASAYIKF